MNLAEEIIGTPAYDQLLARTGGTDYRIPSRIDSPSGLILIEWIGKEAAAKLINWGAGDTFYAGGANERIIRQRALLIRQLHAQGKTIAELTRVKFEVTYSDRHIRRLLTGDLDSLTDTCQAYNSDLLT